MPAGERDKDIKEAEKVKRHLPDKSILGSHGRIIKGPIQQLNPGSDPSAQTVPGMPKPSEASGNEVITGGETVWTTPGQPPSIDKVHDN
jgi:hypothetical protein